MQTPHYLTRNAAVSPCTSEPAWAHGCPALRCWVKSRSSGLEHESHAVSPDREFSCCYWRGNIVFTCITRCATPNHNFIRLMMHSALPHISPPDIALSRGHRFSGARGTTAAVFSITELRSSTELRSLTELLLVLHLWETHNTRQDGVKLTVISTRDQYSISKRSVNCSTFCRLGSVLASAALQTCFEPLLDPVPHRHPQVSNRLSVPRRLACFTNHPTDDVLYACW